MNKEAIRRVANAIAKAARSRHGLAGVVGFNMANWISNTEDRIDYVDSCGTVACIAGWTCLLELPEADVVELSKPAPLADKFYSLERKQNRNIMRKAREALGLDFNEAEALFVPSHKPLDQITAEEAVATLRYLAKTGQVHWATPKHQGETK